MTEGTGKKLFSAELQRMKAKGVQLPGDGSDSGAVLAAIAALRSEVKALDVFVRSGEISHAAAPAVPAAAPTGGPDIDALKAEIDAMSASIEQTKIEIAALRPLNSPPDRLTVVTNELDAIVSATEAATQGILEAAEKIDNAMQQLQAHDSDTFTRHIVDDVSEAVVGIFEKCNFQDITGQRINKVVKTLQFIEERVNRMIDIWGKEAFEHLPQAEEEIDEDQKLLNGPALENQGISQEDIDKLFG